jgi:DMSO/TMAO reductase YedYZ molybdopterin-dependent catalytic subunit
MIQKLVIGFISSIGISVIGLLARILAVGPFPAEKLYNTVTFWMGTPAMFQLVHKLLGFGQAGKIAAFMGVLLGWVGGLTLLGLLPTIPAAVLVGVISAAVLVSSSGPIALLWGLVYGAIYYGIRLALAPVASDPERRGVLQTLGIGSAAILGMGGFTILQPLFRGNAPKTVATAGGTGKVLLPGLTAQEDFYYVSINNEALDPKIKEADWKLEVGGMVKNPSTFTLQQLKDQFEVHDLEFVMSCISNPVGGDLAGNAIWTGFKMKDLMQAVGVEPGGKWIVWEAADNFYESIPLAEVLEEDCRLVYGINGDALDQKHGFPLRVLIPGRYGMKSPRWITKITVASEEKLGYWANRGWTRTAFVQPTSRFDFPKDGDSFKPDESKEFHGVAYAGKKPITKVEVSIDDGKTWLEAKLTAQRSKYAWVLWTLPWKAVKGTSKVTVRCWADGVVQDPKQADSLPEAASGYHSVVINVA